MGVKDQTKIDAIERTRQAHLGQDRALDLALAVGLTPLQFVTVKHAVQSLTHHADWQMQRTPHGLTVDCTYLLAKREGLPVSTQKMRALTLDIFGVGTQPRPSDWMHPIYAEVLSNVMPLEEEE